MRRSSTRWVEREREGGREGGRGRRSASDERNLKQKKKKKYEMFEREEEETQGRPEPRAEIGFSTLHLSLFPSSFLHFLLSLASRVAVLLYLPPFFLSFI